MLQPKAAVTRRPTRRLRRVLFAGLLALFIAVAVLLPGLINAVGGRPAGARLARTVRSAHFIGDKFHNPQADRQTTREEYREQLTHWIFGREQRVPAGTIPIIRRKSSDYASQPVTGLRVTWMGHATALIEIDGRRVLTDPVWSERASPLSFMGPKRFHPAPIEFVDLPPIDLVLISHDHYDHLDMRTIQNLAARGTLFVVPRGVGAHLEHWSVQSSQISELDWDEHVEVRGLRIVATPARHYSGRSPFRSNETLWASFVIEGPMHHVFFSGDSGYGSHFKGIGDQHGPFDLTLIKIGASDPTWSDIHMTPEEAVQSHLDLKGSLLVPIHWGTFNMAYHSWSEPAERVLAAANKAGVKLSVPRPGEFVDGNNSHDPWWREVR